MFSLVQSDYHAYFCESIYFEPELPESRFVLGTKITLAITIIIIKILDIYL